MCLNEAYTQEKKFSVFFFRNNFFVRPKMNIVSQKTKISIFHKISFLKKRHCEIFRFFEANKQNRTFFPVVSFRNNFFFVLTQVNTVGQNINFFIKFHFRKKRHCEIFRVFVYKASLLHIAIWRSRGISNLLGFWENNPVEWIIFSRVFGAHRCSLTGA